MTFIEGQRVRMLVACQGDDENDIERLYPPGALGTIDRIDGRGIHHVEVGPLGDEQITVCFDAGEEAKRSMQALESDVRVTAYPVAYSSVVGASVMLRDVNHKFVGQIALLQVEGGRAEQEALRDRVVAAINAGQAERQVKHKNGRTYDVLPEALFQVSTKPFDGDIVPSKSRLIKDGDPVTVYRNPEGMHFVRFPDEMVSPRFEDVQS